MHQIKITIDKQGQASIKVEGYEGPTCATVSKPFVDALGLCLSDKPTEEFYQQTTQEQEEHQ